MEAANITAGHLILISALVTATILLWASRRLPEYLTALFFFTGAMILNLAPAGLIFSGFASTAFWLVLAGFVIGIAIRNTGLAARCARFMALRLPNNYPAMVFGVVGLTYALAFFMPSNLGRIMLLMPIVLAFAESVGFGEDSPGRIGLALAVGFGTFQLSTSILPANVPNVVMAGAIESHLGLHLSYLSYLLLHAPVLGILKGLLIALCIAWLCRDAPTRAAPTPMQPPWSLREKRLTALLATTLGLWVTDSLHGIAPAWVGLGAACFCLLPRVGFVTGEEFGREVNHRTSFYVTGIIGLSALVDQSGLGARIGDALFAVAPMSPAAPFQSFASIVGVASLLNFVVTANGVPALFTPLAQSLATVSGLPLLTVLMIQVMGFATPILPYQASPIVVAMDVGRIPFLPALKLSLLVAAVSYAVLLPLNYFWFRLLGWIT